MAVSLLLSRLFTYLLVRACFFCFGYIFSNSQHERERKVKGMEDVDSGDRLMGWTAVLINTYVFVMVGFVQAFRLIITKVRFV